MKRNELRESVNDQPINQVEDEVSNDNLDETDWHALEVSAIYYERRWRNRIRLHQGDWWIAIGLYSLLISVAFMTI